MAAQTDRYISFCGINCDIRAGQFVARLEQRIDDQLGDPKWQAYFREKLVQCRKMNHDPLFFIGSQMNALYAYLETMDDEEGLGLLWDIEQECC